MCGLSCTLYAKATNSEFYQRFFIRIYLFTLDIQCDALPEVREKKNMYNVYEAQYQLREIWRRVDPKVLNSFPTLKIVNCCLRALVIGWFLLISIDFCFSTILSSRHTKHLYLSQQNNQIMCSTMFKSTQHYTNSIKIIKYNIVRTALHITMAQRILRNFGRCMLYVKRFFFPFYSFIFITIHWMRDFLSIFLKDFPLNCYYFIQKGDMQTNVSERNIFLSC